VDVLRTERDIPINYVVIATLILMIPIFILISCSIIPADIGISPDSVISFLRLVRCTSLLAGLFLFHHGLFCWFDWLDQQSSIWIASLSLLIICLIFMALFSTQTGMVQRKPRNDWYRRCNWNLV